ncbi:integrase core domain-containing protein, partial [Yoonia sp.]|uniref:integrase core domain-containing protein n=1 Tax=Yoonia sp. TaxID=2212373 RepID=UPI004048866B
LSLSLSLLLSESMDQIPVTQKIGHSQHIRGAPFHPQTQGKIERWHQTMKNRVLLENYYLPGDLERQIGAFVEYYNNQRYHESLNNVTPADVYFGRDKAILHEREKIKKQTIHQRRLQHRKQAA